jgi:type I restriction enzyme M protein
MHTPSWFTDEQVLIVNAKTCGINKDGKEQYLVNPSTGTRSNSEIDDSLADCCDSIVNRDFSREETFYHSLDDMIKKDVFVPKFYDHKTLVGIETLVGSDDNFTLKTLGSLVKEQSILIFGGHGSPSSDQRLGIVPYIKVSDLRAGHININPTNMVPLDLAKKFWRGNSSGLMPYDLISPERASKNIGEFCVLMPGQEQAVFTKEVIVVRAIDSELFDQFYLLWALSLDVVRAQWERIVFMQTNREDVGKRMLEIVIPVPNDIKAAQVYSKAFKEYYMSLETSRTKFIGELKSSEFDHHIHLGE